MSRTASDGTILGAMLKKDLRLYARNKVYLLMTAVSLAAFAVVFWIIPDTVDDTISLAVSPPIGKMVVDSIDVLRELGVPEEQLQQLVQEDFTEGEEGLDLVQLQNEEQLKRVIAGTLELYRTADGSLISRDLGAGEKKPKDANLLQLKIGIAFPENFIVDVARNEKTQVTVFSDAAVPEEIQGAMQSFVREIAYQIAGRGLPVELPDEETIVLGPDRASDPVSLRDRMRSMLAFFVLMVETFAMASLISTEILQRTVTALLVTPLKTWHFLSAKTIFGTGLALSQGLLILALVGAFTPTNWSLLVVTMIIGSLLFTGVAMLIGSAGKDFIGQLMYALLFTIPLLIPSFSVLFPGTAAAWVQAIPSYPVAELLVGITIYQAGWAESAGTLAYALVWVVLLYGVSLFVLKRKVEAL